MYAVSRETYYPPEIKIQETKAFTAFQNKHAEQPGYVGTIVTKLEEGRYLTVTLWETEEQMNNARKALGQVVEELLTPLMTSPAILLGTGPVVVNDLNENASR